VTTAGFRDLFSASVPEWDENDVEKRAHAAVEGGDDAWDAFTLEMMRNSCAFFASEFLSGPIQAPYNGHFVVADHHMEWDDLVAEQDRICVLAPRNHGKCQVEGALINAADGRRIPIESWSGGEVIAYDEDTHKLVPTYAPASRRNGHKRCLEITTKTGRRVRVTENHPLRLLDRWLRADQLVVGQRIGVPRRLQTSASKTVDDAWLLGMLIGDGGLTGTGVTITVADAVTLGAVKQEAARLGWGLTRRPADPITYGLHANYAREGGPVQRMRALGLMGHTAHEKRVPKELFTASDTSIAEFLAGYLEADGTCALSGGGAVEFYSVSEQLLRDVQHLLVRLGVVAVLGRKKGKYLAKDHWSWRLTVRGQDVLRLAAQISLRGGKATQLAALVQMQEAKDPPHGPAIDRFPRDVWEQVEHSETWFRDRGHPRPTPQYEPTRAKLRAIAVAENNSELLALADADVLWDEIIAIEDIGEQETWSMHVPGLVNYVSDDVINHNTFYFDFAYPIWKAAYLPGGRGYIFSATQDQAVRILEDIKEEIESNPKLAFLNPKNKARNWSKTQITLANGHKIYARGYGTKIRGAHPDWIVVDDGLNDEDAYSELVRTKHIDYFYTAITNMVNPGGQVIVVGTPFHAADLYADLSTNKRYCYRKYAARDAEGKALWPERFCATKAERLRYLEQGIVVESLEEREIEIKSVRFTREFMCEPISDEMSLFPGKLFQGAPVEQIGVKMGQPRAYYEELGITSFYIGFDFAISTSTGADYTVGFVLGVDQFRNRWVIDIQRHHGLAYNQQKGLINALGQKYDADLIYLESNQMQRIFGDELIRETDLPIFKFVTSGTKKNNNSQPTGNTHTMNKNTLEGGVPQLRVLLENAKVRIPRGDRESVEKGDEWIKEMRHFTWLEGKLQGVGSHDDTVMAFWIANCAVRAGAFGFSFGDDDDLSLDELLEQQMAEPDSAALGNDPVGDLLKDWGGDVELEDAPKDAIKEFLQANLTVENLVGPKATRSASEAALVPDELLHPDELAWRHLPGLGNKDFEW